MFLMFHLERPDVLPVGDLGIRRAIERAYGLDGLPDASDDGGDRRALAPAADARLPLPVALAGQRARLAPVQVSISIASPLIDIVFSTPVSNSPTPTTLMMRTSPSSLISCSPPALTAKVLGQVLADRVDVTGDVPVNRAADDPFVGSALRF